jgi:hypothetical protein
MDLVEHLLASPPQGDELDVPFVQNVEVLVGGQLGIED